MPKKDDCNRRNVLLKELIHDWDELNIAFKALIIVGMVLFMVVMCIAIFSNGSKGIANSIEVVFRSTLASVFGFLLSSNIKNNSKKKTKEIEEIQAKLKQVETELEKIDDIDDLKETNDDCKLEYSYSYRDINLVQIIIALSICIVSISMISVLLITNNLENIPAVSQLRDLMCSSVGFLIGESGKK